MISSETYTALLLANLTKEEVGEATITVIISDATVKLYLRKSSGHYTLFSLPLQLGVANVNLELERLNAVLKKIKKFPYLLDVPATALTTY